MNTKLILCKISIMLFTRIIIKSVKGVIFFLFSSFLLFGCATNHKLLSENFQNDLLNKRVIEKINNREELTITHKTPRPKNNKSYYWFRNGEIHISKGAYEGFLVNNSYTKFNKKGGLLKKGMFKVGVKNGIWTTWHDNGSKATLVTYKNGKKRGRYSALDTLGNIVVSGRFKHNLKHGTWINTLNKESLLYKKGVLVLKDTINYKPFLFERILKKYTKDSLTDKDGIRKNKVAKPKLKNKQKAKKINKKNKKSTAKKNKQKGIFNRLFNKNTKKRS